MAKPRNLDKKFVRELADAFAVVTAEYSGRAQEVVRNIADNFYLEEALATDDPVRPAELEVSLTRGTEAHQCPRANDTEHHAAADKVLPRTEFLCPPFWEASF